MYLINALANVAIVDKKLSEFVGQHGACEIVVSVMEQRPRDLQLQASGCKAIRALALSGGRNLNVLGRSGGPGAVARAQGLFLRDREVQLACLGAVKALCGGGHGPNREALVRAGSVPLMESALQKFSDDAEVIAQALSALVEVVCFSSASSLQAFKHAEWVGSSLPVNNVGIEQVWPTNYNTATTPVEPQRSPASSLPVLTMATTGEAKGVLFPNILPVEKVTCRSSQAAVEACVSRAIGTVLTAMECNSCREVSLAAFDALGHLLVVDAVDDNNDDREEVYNQTTSAADCSRVHDKQRGGAPPEARGMLQWAKIGYAVKRVLKLNRRDDAELAERGGKILALVAIARGKMLAQ